MRLRGRRWEKELPLRGEWMCWQEASLIMASLVMLLVVVSSGHALEKTSATVSVSQGVGVYGEAMTFEDWTGVVSANANPVLSRQKLLRVYSQLLKYSGKNFRVYPYQTNLIGLAKPGGVIMIDISIVGKPVEILAFWLAHEWAHQDLGHAVNRFATPQMTINAMLRRQRFPTSSEDEADIWAARFMARHNYPIAGVLENICRLSKGRPDKSHSSRELRAMNVAAAYNVITGQNVVSSCAGGLAYQHVASRKMQQGCRACGPALSGRLSGLAGGSFVSWCMAACKVR